jgi:hypothetical protein
MQQPSVEWRRPARAIDLVLSVHVLVEKRCLTAFVVVVIGDESANPVTNAEWRSTSRAGPRLDLAADRGATVRADGNVKQRHDLPDALQ